MVKILSNGDIVPDDDPRAQQASSRTNEQHRQGGIQHDQNNQQVYGHGPQVSLFDNLNGRLLQAGLPRLNLGSYVIEPIVSVGLLVVFLLMGFKGILFGGLLFLVCKWSSGAGAAQDRRPNQRRGWAARGGHRLGR